MTFSELPWRDQRQKSSWKWALGSSSASRNPTASGPSRNVLFPAQGSLLFLGIRSRCRSKSQGLCPAEAAPPCSKCSILPGTGMGKLPKAIPARLAGRAEQQMGQENKRMAKSRDNCPAWKFIGFHWPGPGAGGSSAGGVSSLWKVPKNSKSCPPPLPQGPFPMCGLPIPTSKYPVL